MCLKYFIGHSTCDHREYLGSHHCSMKPCDLDTQHFHYIEDDFPVPWPEDTQFEQIALACKICASKQRDKVDPDETPVHPYPPTNDFQVKEIQPTGYLLPTKVVRAEAGDVMTECTTESEDSDDSFDYDYKSLSDADDKEWSIQKETAQDPEVHMDHQATAQRHHEYLQSQLRDLPNYLQRQFLPFVPPGFTPEGYGTGNYLHYPMPHVGYLAPPSVLSIPPWHRGMPSLSSIPDKAPSTRPDDSPLGLLPAFIPEDADKPTTPAMLPQRLATPPPTPPMHPLPPRPAPPFIVGTITDAYLRMEAAKRRHIRERVRRQKSSLRDALPVRSMALTDFMVEKRAQRGHHKDVDAPEDMGMNPWLSLPFAGESSDTECGAEEYIRALGGEQATSRFSCRLVPLM